MPNAPEPTHTIFTEVGVKRAGQANNGQMVFIDIEAFGSERPIIRLLLPFQQVQGTLAALAQGVEMAAAERNKNVIPGQMYREATLDVTGFKIGQSLSDELIPLELSVQTNSKFLLTLSLQMAEALSTQLQQAIQKLRQPRKGH